MASVVDGGLVEEPSGESCLDLGGAEGRQHPFRPDEPLGHALEHPDRDARMTPDELDQVAVVERAECRFELVDENLFEEVDHEAPQRIGGTFSPS